MNTVGQHDTGRKTADKHSGHGFEFSGTKDVCKGCSVVSWSLDGVVFSDGATDWRHSISGKSNRHSPKKA